MEYLEGWIALSAAGGGIFAAYGRSMYRLNLQGAKIEEIENELEKHEIDVTDRLARIETKLDLMLRK